MFCKQTIFFAAMLGVAMCDIEFLDLIEKPDEFKDEEGCYSKDTEEVIGFDESRYFAEPCMRFLCTKDFFEKETCPEIVESADVEVHPGNPDEPFPLCCPAAAAPVEHYTA